MKRGRSQSRFASAIRTLREVYRRQLRFRLGRPVEITVQLKTVGYVERLRLKSGRIHIVGWVSAESIRLETELESKEIIPNLARIDISTTQGARGFDVNLSGTQTLTVLVDGRSVFKVSFASLARRLRALARTFIVVPWAALGTPRDLAAYFLRGDSAAGNALEARLLPVDQSQANPVASAGLFETKKLPSRETLSSVDVIVPVFNAYDELRICLDNLAENTAEHHRVILVDDASSDPRVLELLEAFATKRETAVLLQKPQNEGFIAAVNSGLEKAQGHVVLLNTDAFVPSGWVERLIAPILEDPLVASTTPMSNNAEIANAPVISAEWEVSEHGRLAADTAAKSLAPTVSKVQAPTGIGFCMALSQHWLKHVPVFDKAFGKGYGEEVDWCQKTAGQGGRHLILGNLFVAHQGGASFAEEKLARIQTNNAIIARRYPNYEASVRAFKQGDPLIGPRLAIGLALLSAEGRVSVYMAHRQGGGATLWLEKKIKGHIIAEESAVVIKDGDIEDHILIELHTPKGTTIGNVPMVDLSEFLKLLSRKVLIYSCLVSARDPLGMIERAISALEEGDGFHVLLHDFFPLCPSYNLLDVGGSFCGLPENDACQACYVRLSNLSGQRPMRIDQWREAWRSYFNRADRIEVFSRDSKNHLVSLWPEFDGKISVHPHEVDWRPRPVTYETKEPRVIGVLGAIGYSKGAGVLQALAKICDSRARIVVIGKIDPNFLHPNICVHGAYQREEIADLAEKYNISRWFIPAIWPETFSFTAHECLSTGIPVYCFDLGAQAEAMRQAQNGIVLPASLDIQDLYRRLLNDKA